MKNTNIAGKEVPSMDMNCKEIIREQIEALKEFQANLSRKTPDHAHIAGMLADKIAMLCREFASYGGK